MYGPVQNRMSLRPTPYIPTICQGDADARNKYFLVFGRQRQQQAFPIVVMCAILGLQSVCPDA